MKLAVLLSFCIYPFIIQGQQLQPTHEKKAFIDSVGLYYQQASMPVYLFISTAPDGVPLPVKSETGHEIKLEGHGVHAIRHYNFNSKKFDEFQIYADGIAPVTISSFSGAPSYLRGERQFYGVGLQITLKASDEMSGVDNIFHKVDAAEFDKYKALTLNSEGHHKYVYYSVDRTGNVEALRVREFTIDLSAPEIYHNIIGISSQNVISTNSSIYLTASDTLSGVAKTFIRFDKENFRLYPGGNIPFQYLNDGEHEMTYFSVDNVSNKGVEKTVKFYLDKTAPIMSADVLGDKFIVGERVYFSGRTKLKLTAVDNKSGIKDMMFSINDAPYGKYTEPFYLPNRSGIHNVKYYAIDNTNNRVKDDFEHSIGVIYVDLTGPTLSHSFTGPSFIKADTVLISPNTKIVLTAADPESGLKKIAYALDASSEEIPYTAKPFDVSAIGLHTLNYFGYDNVNNRNSKSSLFFVDGTGPQINAQFAVAPGKEGKYPSYTSIYLSATDTEVGAGEIRYSINGSKEQTYNAPLKGFLKNKEYTIKVKATDLLGNTSETEIKFKTERY